MKRTPESEAPPGGASLSARDPAISVADGAGR